MYISIFTFFKLTLSLTKEIEKTVLFFLLLVSLLTLLDKM